MFTNWLLTVFPAEMKRGWDVVRVNLGLWLALSTLITVVRHSLPQTAADDRTLAIGLTVAGTLATLAILVATITLLDHAARGQRATSEKIISTCLSRALPLFVYAMVTVATCSGAASLIMLGVRLLIADTPIVDNTAAALGMLIYLSLLVRFCFFPYFTVLRSRGELEKGLLPETGAGRALGLVVWPLVASARLGDGIRWRILPYVALPYALRLAVSGFPAAFSVPLDIAYWIVVLVTQAVLLNYFRDALAARS